jgi:hypothetical protein
VRFHFPLCDFILVTHTDSCKQAQRAAILLPISFSRSCAPVTFPDSRTSAQGEVFLPTEATAAVFDFCRRRQDLDFVSFCSVLASSAKLLCWWLSSGEVLQLQTVVRRTTCFFFSHCLLMEIHPRAAHFRSGLKVVPLWSVVRSRARAREVFEEKHVREQEL